MKQNSSTGPVANDDPQSDPVKVWKVGAKPDRQQQDDLLAIEEPLQIEIDGQPWLTTMRTPGDDQELTLGLMLAEGVISSMNDIANISRCPEDAHGNLVRVILAAGCQFNADSEPQNRTVSSACGICGKTSIDTLQAQFDPICSEAMINSELLAELPGRLAANQSTFQNTGGLHAAGLFDLNGNLQVIREDVGRHNAVDKVIGYALMQKELPLNDSILLVSGRVAFEIVHKAATGGIAIIAAISAPTSLAVSYARRNNQTLIGFLRGPQMNVYSGIERIK